MSLHVEEPTITPEQMLGVDDPRILKHDLFLPLKEGNIGAAEQARYSRRFEKGARGFVTEKLL
jgi:hypothetical protein